ncbi:MAG: YhdT family protein [Eubacterium sp.]|nr:YhdT family protein [Eubacterium sp.]
MSSNEKEKQIVREARATIAALAAIVIFWIVSGFGVSRLHITVFHTPLWFFTGCVGTWIFASVLVAWMIGRVYKDFELGEEEETDER